LIYSIPSLEETKGKAHFDEGTLLEMKKEVAYNERSEILEIIKRRGFYKKLVFDVHKGGI